ncbi:MAG: nitrilase family protein, partial [Chitinophagaceae bacterium]|nr:nitrilase family protein [Chitinophagaceae bacterium]
DGHGIEHSGDSMLVDPLGEVIYTKSNGADIFTHTLDKENLETIRERFPFWKDADQFIIQSNKTYEV